MSSAPPNPVHAPPVPVPSAAPPGQLIAGANTKELCFKSPLNDFPQTVDGWVGGTVTCHENKKLVGQLLTVSGSMRAWDREGNMTRMDGYYQAQHKGRSQYFRIAMQGHVVHGTGKDKMVEQEATALSLFLPALTPVQSWEILPLNTETPGQSIIRVLFPKPSPVAKLQIVIPIENQMQADMAGAFHEAFTMMDKLRRDILTQYAI